MKIAMYPGSFNPITKGHLEMIERASKMFDKLYVIIGVNPDKKHNLYLDDIMVLLELIKKECEKFENVEVEVVEGLLVKWASKNNINYIIRGLRNETDFQSEIQLANINRYLDSNIETIFLPTRLENTYVSSTNAKQIMSFDKEKGLSLLGDYTAEFIRFMGHQKNFFRLRQLYDAFKGVKND